MMTKNALYRAIGEQIKISRQKNSLNQEDLASFVGLTRSSIAQIETGKQAPSIYILYKICDKLKTDITKVLPQEVFDTLSADRFSEKEKEKVIKILENVVKEGGEYEQSEYSDESK